MPNADLVDASIAVVSLLSSNTSALSVTFTVERSYRPDYDVTKDSALKLFVYGFDPKLNPGGLSRSMNEYDLTVLVPVYCRVTKDSTFTSTVDGLIYFCQQLVDLFNANRQLGTGGKFELTTAACSPAFSVEHLDKGVFVSGIALTYRAIR